MLRLSLGVVGNTPFFYYCSLLVLYTLPSHNSKPRPSRDKSWTPPD